MGLKISAVLPTIRYGSFDILTDWVKSQTMPQDEFEVILIDELWERRQGMLDDYPNIRHVAPWRAKEFYDNSAAFNMALSLATGELVCFFIDFFWVEPDYLQRHWDFYKANPGCSLSGYTDRYEFPALREDAENGLWSIFKEPFDPAYFQSAVPVYKERKGGSGIIHSDGRIEMPGNLIYLIPDSVPMDVLRACNGIDEAYDGGYGAADICLGVRANILGHQFILDPTLVAKKLGTPELSAKIPGVKKPKVRTPEQNFEIFKQRMKAISEGRETIAVPEGRGAWR